MTSCTKDEARAQIMRAGIDNETAALMMQSTAKAARQVASRNVALMLIAGQARIKVGYTAGAGWWYSERGK